MKLFILIFLFLVFSSSCDDKDKSKAKKNSSLTRIKATSFGKNPTLQNNANTTKQSGTIRAPLYKWEMVVPNQEVPEGIVAIDAKHCGVCHPQHYEEWTHSTHSHAWTDRQFQAEIKKDSSPIFCINCHVPLQNQQEYFVKGFWNGDIYKPVKEKNPKFDPELQKEGITCAACHIRNNAIVGPTGSPRAPHKTVKDPEFLSEQLCITCHNAVALLTPTLPCTFETADEWKKGPYFGKEDCITCHMPETEREIFKGYGKKKSRFHYFAGSGIPKQKGAKTKMLNGFNFYASTLKKHYAANEELTFSLELKNENAGHNVPTGDPERFFIIHLKIENAKGKVVASQEGYIGEKWEWYPKAEKKSDTNVPPGKSRIFSIHAILPQKGNYTLHVKVSKHRMNDAAAAFNKLGEEYPRFVTVYEKSYTFSRK